MLISKAIHLSTIHYPFNFCGSPSRKILMVDDPRRVNDKEFHGEYKILSYNKYDHLGIDTKHKAEKTCLHQRSKDGALHTI